MWILSISGTVSGEKRGRERKRLKGEVNSLSAVTCI